jgi:hypothetical protein
VPSPAAQHLPGNSSHLHGTTWHSVSRHNVAVRHYVCRVKLSTARARHARTRILHACGCRSSWCVNTCWTVMQGSHIQRWHRTDCPPHSKLTCCLVQPDSCPGQVIQVAAAGVGHPGHLSRACTCIPTCCLTSSPQALQRYCRSSTGRYSTAGRGVVHTG